MHLDMAQLGKWCIPREPQIEHIIRSLLYAVL